MTDGMDWYDTNGDSVEDTGLADTGGDGRYDTAFADTDEDGVIDSKAFDFDGDGYLETAVADLDKDGYFETTGSTTTPTAFSTRSSVPPVPPPGSRLGPCRRPNRSWLMTAQRAPYPRDSGSSRCFPRPTRRPDRESSRSSTPRRAPPRSSSTRCDSSPRALPLVSISSREARERADQVAGSKLAAPVRGGCERAEVGTYDGGGAAVADVGQCWGPARPHPRRRGHRLRILTGVSPLYICRIANAAVGARRRSARLSPRVRVRTLRTGRRPKSPTGPGDGRQKRPLPLPNEQLPEVLPYSGPKVQ